MKSERSLDSPNLRESARRTVSSHAPDTHSPGLHPLPCLQHVLWPRKHILHSARVYGSLTDPWLRLPVEHPTLYPRGLEGSLRTLERSSPRRQGLGRLHNQVFAQEVHPQTTKRASASPSSLCQSIFDNQDNTNSWVKVDGKCPGPYLVWTALMHAFLIQSLLVQRPLHHHLPSPCCTAPALCSPWCRLLVTVTQGLFTLRTGVTTKAGCPGTSTTHSDTCHSTNTSPLLTGLRWWFRW